MRVKDIFSLYGDDSKNFELLSGANGLSREVLKVDILEVPDGVFWATPGEVIITTGYSLKKDDITLDTFVQILIDKGVSALGIKIGRYIEGIPQRVLNYAEVHDFPIFSVPITLSYEQIITPINARLLNDYNFLIINSFRDDLNKLHKEGFDINDVINAASKYIGRNIHVLWADTLSAIENSSAPGNNRIIEKIKNDIFLINKSENEYEVEIEKVFYSIYKIESVKETLAFLCIEESIKNISNTDKEIIREIIQVIAIYILSNMNKIKLIYKSIEDFYFSVATGDYIEKELELIKDAEFMNVEIDKKIYICIFKYKTCKKYNLKEIAKRISESMKEDNKRCVYKELNDKLVFFIEVDIFKNTFRHEQKYFENLNLKIQKIFDGSSFKIGVSNICDRLEQLHFAYDEAEFSIFIGEKIEKEKNCFFYDEYIIYHLLKGISKHPASIRMYNNTIERIKLWDSKNNLDLYNTIRVLISSDFNIGKSSERLFIHRNTLYKRINKINNILKLDINKSENQLLLQIVIKMDEMLEK